MRSTNRQNPDYNAALRATADCPLPRGPRAGALSGLDAAERGAHLERVATLARQLPPVELDDLRHAGGLGARVHRKAGNWLRGVRDGLDQLVQALRARGVGQAVDVVPEATAHVPLGYRRMTPIGVRPRLVRDYPQAWALRDALMGFASGHIQTLEDVAALLARQGLIAVPAHGQAGSLHVRALLCNPFYAGQDGGRRPVAAFVPLISVEDHALIQSRFADVDARRTFVEDDEVSRRWAEPVAIRRSA